MENLYIGLLILLINAYRSLSMEKRKMDNAAEVSVLYEEWN